MPEWAKARTGTEVDPALKDFIERLKRQLFGEA